MMEFDVECEKAVAGDSLARKDLLETFYAGIEVDAVNEWLKKAIADKDERIVFAVADWFEETQKDHKKYLEVLEIASDMGNEAASYWLGEAYREGKICDREFDKALEFYRKAEQQGYDYDCEINPLVPDAEPIDDCKMNLGVEDGLTLDWWLFVLERNPTPALKYALGEWYWHPFENCAWSTLGQEDKVRALELLESAAIEGFDAAILQLLEIYSCDARFKNITKAQEMFKRAEELEIDDVEFSEAVEGYAAELGVVSKRIKDSEVNELEKNVDDNYEEMTARARETRGSADGWMFPNGHDDGESPDTGAFGG